MPVDQLRTRAGQVVESVDDATAAARRRLALEEESPHQADMSLEQVGRQLERVEQAVDYGGRVIRTGNIAPERYQMEDEVMAEPPPLFSAIGPGGLRGAAQLLRRGDDVARVGTQATRYADDVAQRGGQAIRGNRELLAGGPRDVAAQQLADDLLRQRQALSQQPGQVQQTLTMAERARGAGSARTAQLDPADPAYLQRARQQLAGGQRAIDVPRFASEIAPAPGRTISAQQIGRTAVPLVPVAAATPLAGFADPSVTTKGVQPQLEPQRQPSLAPQGQLQPRAQQQQLAMLEAAQQQQRAFEMARQPTLEGELSGEPTMEALPRQDMRQRQRQMLGQQAGQAQLARQRQRQRQLARLRQQARQQQRSRNRGGRRLPPPLAPPGDMPDLDANQQRFRQQDGTAEPFLSIQPVASPFDPIFFGDGGGQAGGFGPPPGPQPAALGAAPASDPQSLEWSFTPPWSTISSAQPQGFTPTDTPLPMAGPRITPWGQVRWPDGTFGPRVV